MARSLLTDSTLIADVTHYVRCCHGGQTLRGSMGPPSPVTPAHMLAGIGRTAIEAVDSYGLDVGRFSALMRLARYRVCCARAAARDGRPSAARCRVVEEAALSDLGHAIVEDLRDHAATSRCHLHEAAPAA